MKRMKLLSGLFLCAWLLTGCSLQEAAKETGEAVETGVGNVIEGVKQAPKAIGDAARKVVKEDKEEQ